MQQQQQQQAATAYQEPASPPLPHLPSPADLRAMSTATPASPGVHTQGLRVLVFESLVPDIVFNVRT